MTTTWYCRTCEEEIDESAVDEHEAQGHAVRGFMRPDRLLSNDPWQVGSTDRPTADRAAEEPTPDRKTNDRTGNQTAPDPPADEPAAYRIVDEPTADRPTDEQAPDRPAGDAEDDSE